MNDYTELLAKAKKALDKHRCTDFQAVTKVPIETAGACADLIPDLIAALEEVQAENKRLDAINDALEIETVEMRYVRGDLIQEIKEHEAKLAKQDGVDWKGIVEEHLYYNQLFVRAKDPYSKTVVIKMLEEDAYTLIWDTDVLNPVGKRSDYKTLEEAIIAALELCEGDERHDRNKTHMHR